MSPSFSHLTALDIAPPDMIDLLADAGYQSTGIRLSPAMAGGLAYPMEINGPKFNETAARLKDRQVRFLDIEVMLIDAETNVNNFIPAIETGAKLGASRICVNGEDPDLNRFTERWIQLCDIAAQFNMEVDLEFMVWRPIKTFQIAADIVRNSGCRNGKVLVDALHLFRSGGTVAEIRAADPQLIGALQLCDGPIHGPDINDTSAVLSEARAGRLPPLEGEFPLIELVKAIPLSTPISLEVPMGASARFTDLLSRLSHIRQAGERCVQLARSITPPPG